MTTNARARKAHAQLLRLYGEAQGKKCGDCDHFLRYKQENVWFKCALTVRGGASMDWRKTWQACGKFRQLPR